MPVYRPAHNYPSLQKHPLNLPKFLNYTPTCYRYHTSPRFLLSANPWTRRLHICIVYARPKPKSTATPRTTLTPAPALEPADGPVLEGKAVSVPVVGTSVAGVVVESATEELAGDVEGASDESGGDDGATSSTSVQVQLGRHTTTIPGSSQQLFVVLMRFRFVQAANRCCLGVFDLIRVCI